jgi:MFS family permease
VAAPADEPQDTAALAVEGHPAVAVGALLVATVLLRIGAFGAGQAVLLDLKFLAHDLPNEISVGMVAAAQPISEMAFAFVLARYADRLGRTRFLIGGPVIGMLAMLLISRGDSQLQIALARVVEGLGAAAFVPTALGTIAAATTGHEGARAQASGAFEGATLAGIAGGFLIGPLAWHYFHRDAFLLLSGFYLLAALICLKLVPKVPPLPVSPLKRVFATIVGPGPIRTFIPAWIAVNTLVGAWLNHLATLLGRHVVAGQSLMQHFAAPVISAVLVSWAVLLIAGIGLWTPILKRWGPTRTMRVSVLGSLMICGALGVINHVPLRFAPLMVPFLMGGVLIEAGFGPAAIAYLADCSERLTSDRSTLMAFYTVTLAGGGAIGAFIGGFFARWLYLDGLLLLGVGLTVIAYLALRRIDDRDLVTGPLDAPATAG